MTKKDRATTFLTLTGVESDSQALEGQALKRLAFFYHGTNDGPHRARVTQSGQLARATLPSRDAERRREDPPPHSRHGCRHQQRVLPHGALNRAWVTGGHNRDGFLATFHAR